ncbi:MAG TPA: membrane dipeptidase [Solirubrobacterales bacterium]|nr:membrane dipeptidase [Solirubrobacterales bacterium]
MIVDLHAHYPMHIVPKGKVKLWRLLTSREEGQHLIDRVKALLVDLVSRFRNYPSFHAGPRVRVKYMKRGNVGVALSPVYSFFDELPFGGTTPKDSYLKTLERQIATVTDHVREKHGEDVAIATDPDQLAAAQQPPGKLTLVHSVEGGFHLGSTEEAVTRAVDRLADLGVAYITLAHLIYRGIATDAPALPFMTDAQYRHWLPQPDEGLSDLGRAAVKAMARRRVLIDVSHMSKPSLHDTFDLLEDLETPDARIPVLATHAGYRFGTQEYMLSEDTVERIAARDGVIGLIFARHQIEDGPPPGLPARKGPLMTKRRRIAWSLDVLGAHIDRIEEITRSHRHVALGSDFDGFIKPTLPGLRDMRDMARLERALHDRYGAAAELICSQNALRLLTGYWRGSGA